MFARPPVERPGALGYGSYDDTLHALETAIEPGPFVLGQRFSAADVYLGSQIVWGTMTGTLEQRPSFAAYQRRVTERPAYQRIVAQNQRLAARLTETSAPA